jgi:hypothetical protein
MIAHTDMSSTFFFILLAPIDIRYLMMGGSTTRNM